MPKQSKKPKSKGLTNQELIAKYNVTASMDKFHEALDKMIKTPNPNAKSHK